MFFPPFRRFFRRFLLHSFAQLDVTIWPFTPLFLNLLSLLFFFLQRKWSPAEISQILGSDIFFCVEGLEFTVRERAWTTHESVTKTNIYSSARAEPMVIPEWSLGENDTRYRSHTAGETTCPRYTMLGYESPGKRGRVLLNTMD